MKHLNLEVDGQDYSSENEYRKYIFFQFPSNTSNAYSGYEKFWNVI